MKTLIIVSTPSATFSLELSDLPAGGPQEGRQYEFGGKLYRAVQVVESLGVRDAMGSRVSPDMRLLSFADTVAAGDDALKQRILKATKIGQDGPEEVRSAGGLILGSSEAPKAQVGAFSYEHFIYVKARGDSTTRMPLAPLSLHGAVPEETDGNVAAQ